METALAALWPFTHELFEATSDQDAVAASASHPIRRTCIARVGRLRRPGARATRRSCAGTSTWTPTGGRQGLHTEPFGYMLAEMQHLHRSYPGRPGDRRRRDPPRRPARSPTRRCRRSPSTISASFATSASIRRRRRCRHHADVLRLPRARRHPRGRRALRFATQGYADVTVRVVLSPAWTTDWMTDAGRLKLLEYGDRAAPRSRCSTCSCCSSRCRCPLVCFHAHERDLALRLHAVPGGTHLRRRARDVPALQGALTA